MSDPSQERGRLQAGDGAWNPLETQRPAEATPVTDAVHPLAGISTFAPVPSTDVSLPYVAPIPVPELPKRPTWGAESDRRPEAGPMYPDLFNQALAGSRLANVVPVQ